MKPASRGAHQGGDFMPWRMNMLQEGRKAGGCEISGRPGGHHQRQAPNPKFEGQTKTKLGNNMRMLVENCVTKGLQEYLEENPREAKRIVDNA